MVEFKKYDDNKIGRDFICGDIHGCFKDLEEVMDSVRFDRGKDRMFSVGDLTDRGPESHRALEFIKEPWFIPILGNHEDMILQVYRDKTAPREWHWQNGGKWITAAPSEWLIDYISEIEKLPLIIQVGNVGIIHSLIPNNTTWEEVTGMCALSQLREFILWNRDETAHIRCNGIGAIIAGHTIHKNPVLYGQVCDIDTGAFLKYFDGREGKLTVKEILKL